MSANCEDPTRDGKSLPLNCLAGDSLAPARNSLLSGYRLSASTSPTPVAAAAITTITIPFRPAPSPASAYATHADLPGVALTELLVRGPLRGEATDSEALMEDEDTPLADMFGIAEATIGVVVHVDTCVRRVRPLLSIIVSTCRLT